MPQFFLRTVKLQTSNSFISDYSNKQRNFNEELNSDVILNGALFHTIKLILLDPFKPFILVITVSKLYK